MKTLVFINSNHFAAKASLEVITYAKKLGGEVIAVTYGSNEGADRLGAYGASKVLVDNSLTSADEQQITKLVASAVESTGANTVVFSHDLVAKSVAPRLSVKLKAGLISGAIALPETSNGFTCKVNVFSGKAFATVSVKTDLKIISLLPNSIQPENIGGSATVESFNGNVGTSAIKVVSTKKPEGSIPLPEAELVVSAGRGLKGPENWGMIEELADVLGAATACSKPVSDMGWRPHSEHVGQTGKPVSSNLYIAIGISGAIQHLAGINSSKVKVVINNDPEAPFFKAADYGVIGDAFEVVPELIKKLSLLK